ncbi:MAG: hypothetical protein WD876_02445 [Candidatus Pacearchaeota archaeon]
MVQTTNKAIIFDSGTLISFSMNGITDVIEKLKGIFNGKFIITPDVKREIIDRPMQIKRFNLEALKIKQLLDKKIIELPSSVGLSDGEVARRTEEMLNRANSTYKDKGRDIHIIDSGEASCLAVSQILNEKGWETVIAVDERTTRMLGERPENLGKLLERKLHVKINPDRGNYNRFKEFRFIRSAELIFVAYKRKLLELKNGDVLDALLYAMKFKGCAISSDEISEIKKMA